MAYGTQKDLLKSTDSDKTYMIKDLTRLKFLKIIVIKKGIA